MSNSHAVSRGCCALHRRRPLQPACQAADHLCCLPQRALAVTSANSNSTGGSSITSLLIHDQHVGGSVRRSSRCTRDWCTPRPARGVCVQAAEHETAPLQPSNRQQEETDRQQQQQVVLEHDTRLAIQQQHLHMADSPYTLQQIKVLVETAMLAAVCGLAYAGASLVRLDSYLGYFLPLPIVLASVRSGALAGFNTMVATCVLLGVLLGPLRAATYLLLHGVLATVLGGLWAWRAPWYVVVAGAGLARAGSFMAYISLNSWVTNQNLFVLLLTNILSMLDHVLGAVGWPGAPSPAAILVVMFSALVVHSLNYTFLMYIIYYVVLLNQGYHTAPLPGFLNRIIFRRQFAS